MVVPEEQLAKRARGDDYVPNYIRYPVITPELKAAGERAGGGGSSAGGFGSVGGFGGRQFMH